MFRDRQRLRRECTSRVFPQTTGGKFQKVGRRNGRESLVKKGDEYFEFCKVHIELEPSESSVAPQIDAERLPVAGIFSKPSVWGRNWSGIDDPSVGWDVSGKALDLLLSKQRMLRTPRVD